MNNTREFWTQLPYDLCKDSEDNYSRKGQQTRSRYGRQQGYSESHCWNGHDTGRYTNAIVNDGLAYQDRNPEVRVDVNRPDVDINEQILALKLITKKLESAHKGQNVNWPSSSSCKLLLLPRYFRTLILTYFDFQYMNLFITSLMKALGPMEAVPTMTMKIAMKTTTIITTITTKAQALVMTKKSRPKSPTRTRKKRRKNRSQKKKKIGHLGSQQNLTKMK